MSELKNKELFAEPVPCSARPLLFDDEKCIGCNT